MTDDLTPDRDGDPGLERRLRGALAVLADDVPPPRSPDLPRFAAVRRRRRTAAAAAVLAAGVVVALAGPSAWSALQPTPTPIGGPVRVEGVLTVTCTPDSITTGADHVRASADGIHLRIVNRTGRTGASLDYGPGSRSPDAVAAVVGTLPLVKEETDAVVSVPPTMIRVACNDGSGAEPVFATVPVDDPAGYYRAVDVERVLGCLPTEFPFTTGATGATPLQAAQQAAGGLAGEVELIPGPGYRAAQQVVFLAKGPKTRVMIKVSEEDGRYRAVTEPFCAPGSWPS